MQILTLLFAIEAICLSDKFTYQVILTSKKTNRSLRKHPFLHALRRWGRFARRNVCDSATKIPYWWRKICPESGQKRWLVDGVVTLF